MVLPGGSGFIGRVLARHFSDLDWQVAVLTRNISHQVPGAKVHGWDGRTLGEWTKEFEDAEVVVNLAGRTVNCRYNEKNKAEIYASRLDSTKVVGEAITQSPSVKTWLNASTATIYRHAEDRAMDDATGEIGSGFSVDVAKKWEKALAGAQTPGVRKAAMRTAIVFGSGKGSAMDAFERLVRLGLGGTTGPGTQYVSFVHQDDFARAVQWLIEHPELEGAINISAPNPIPNQDFMRILREAYGIRFGIPSPAPLLEVGAFFLKTETELLLKSRRVVPTRLLDSGFTFNFPTWQAAAEDLAEKRSN